MHGVLLVVQGFDIWCREIICYVPLAFLLKICKARRRESWSSVLQKTKAEVDDTQGISATQTLLVN